MTSGRLSGRRGRRATAEAKQIVIAGSETESKAQTRRVVVAGDVWDGKGVQGKAWTAEVVARARARRLPLAWVHAGNRKPGTLKPRSLADQGKVTFEDR